MIRRGGRGPFHQSRTSGKPGSGVDPSPTLRTLALSANSLTENSASGTLIGAILNTTPGSTLSLFDAAGNKVAISGGNLVAGATNTDYETTGPTFTFTARETLTGATNTPHDTVLTINVVNVFEQPNLGTLTFSSTTVTHGTSTSGTIGGATSGSTITASGLPTGLTINGAARTWAWDGTGAAGSGSFTLTETLSDSANSPQTSTINYTISAGGNAALSTLVDNFNDNSIDPTLWDTGNWVYGSATTAGTVAESSGIARVTPPTSTAGANYNGYISHQLYNLTGSSAFVRILPGSGSLSGNQEFYFGVGPDINNHYLVYVSGTSLLFEQTKAGTKTQVSGSTPVTYSFTTHRWFRLRESGGTIFMDTAPSTAANPPASGDWVNFASATIDSSIIPDKTAVHAAFGSGTSASTSTITVVNFDGFNEAT